MGSVRDSNERLSGLEPYDPKYLPAQVMLSANESPFDIAPETRERVEARLGELAFNRYPDPLANGLRDGIAASCGLERGNVLVGNGGDELLFDVFLAYGGPGRTFINLPPTFSVYAYNAHLTGTGIVDIPRLDDFSVDVDAVVARLSEGDIDLAVLTSPNNPTGNLISEVGCRRLLEASDALILLDEAYIEFADASLVSLLAEHENLLILRTFSKAFSLAGVRVGYLLGSRKVIDEFTKVRQPYSVDAVSQLIASCVLEDRDTVVHERVAGTVARREELFRRLQDMEGVEVWPSAANFLLLRVADAHGVWQELYEGHSVLVRDFSSSAGLSDCLRITVGTEEENAAFLSALEKVLGTQAVRPSG